MNSLSRNDLLDLLASTDPQLRDDLAYAQLARRIESGAEDQHLVELGNRLVRNFSDDAIQTRSFSALVLGCVIDRASNSGLASRDTLLEWFDSLARWYRAESDLRGWDEELGWLHAFAHGADAIGALARASQLREEDLVDLLALVAERLLAPTPFVLRDQEDERLGRAAALVLCRVELSRSSATAWLEPVADALRAGEPGPTPPWVSTTLRTLRVIYVIVDRGFQQRGTSDRYCAPHREVITSALATVLQLASPYTSEL
ncbi:MAG: DUF2785 domain-containing protein [Acidimicrobiales bacterium]